MRVIYGTVTSTNSRDPVLSCYAGRRTGKGLRRKQKLKKDTFKGSLTRNYLSYLRDNKLEPSTEFDFFTREEPGLVDKFGVATPFSMRLGFCNFFNVSNIFFLLTIFYFIQLVF